MSKLTISFNLPEETIESQMALHGNDYHFIISEMIAELRNDIKHMGNKNNAEYWEDKLNDILISNQLKGHF